MNTQHIHRAFDEELRFLANRIAAMGGHAERMVDQSIVALVNSDHELARKVIADDVVLDQAQREIDDRAVVIIAKRQPVADDLREIIGAIRISADLERVGDLGKNIAKRVVAVTETRQPRSLFCAKNIERIGDHATNIAETVYYIVTGKQMPPERPKEDESHRVTVSAASLAER
jgi:phosphate transport system protein